MKLKTLFYKGLILYFLFSSWEIATSEQERLKFEDISEVMSQIFDQHLTYKEMSEEVLKEAFRNYLDQFDPERIYLLESEVQPFLHPSPKKTKQLLSEYKKKNLSIFTAMNVTIQKAIERARRWRSQLERKEQRARLFSLASNQERESDSGFYEWAKNHATLRGRQEKRYIDFIQSQIAHFGASQVMAKEQKVSVLYESETRSMENTYLFHSSDGKPMPPAEKEHYYVLHVLKSLAKSLDAHTTFLDLNEAYDMRMRLEKGYIGVGLDFEQSIDGIVVKEIVKGSAAEKSDQIFHGDLLTSVNGVSVQNLSFDNVMMMLSGERGSSITLSFKREGQDQPIVVSLVRDVILVGEDRVEIGETPFLDGIVGRIALRSFYQNPALGISSEEDVRNAVVELSKKGRLYGLVLDLRDNSGGYLMQAVRVAGLFITNGVVVVSKYGDGSTRYYRDLDASVIFDGPLVVLTSSLTASAAEIVAQALQDYGVALVIGDDRTYGKGSIQSQTVTSGGGTSFFKVTVGKYYTVSGKSPEKIGVSVDIVVPTYEDLIYGLPNPVPRPETETVIPSSYNDRLADIHPDIRGWYFRYYLPTLQEKEKNWRSFIPLLKERSVARLKESLAKEDSLESNDTQLSEAENIVKDMIELENERVARRFEQ